MRASKLTKITFEDGEAVEIIFSRTSISYSSLSFNTLYPKASWAKSFTTWFSTQGTCLISTYSKCFKSLFTIANYFINFSLIHLYSLVIYLITNSESPLISTLFAPKSNKILRPVIKALYFVSLFEHNPLTLNLNLV